MPRRGPGYDRRVGWPQWIRGSAEVEPSLYAADFRRLGAQVDELLAAGCRVFHFDTGDGHFVPPVTIGPVVLRSIAEGIHAAGGVVDCHLMVTDPVHHFDEFARSGADSVTFHVEAVADPAALAARARALGVGVGLASNPETPVQRHEPFLKLFDLHLVMSVHPGFSGQSFIAHALEKLKAA